MSQLVMMMKEKKKIDQFYKNSIKQSVQSRTINNEISYNNKYSN
jgi:hypothetical protein